MAQDINRASLEELERAFQVSSERAREIMQKRDELGGFKSWDDVKKVPGISEGMVENLRQAGFTLGGQS